MTPDGIKAIDATLDSVVRAPKMWGIEVAQAMESTVLALVIVRCQLTGLDWRHVYRKWKCEIFGRPDAGTAAAHFEARGEGSNQEKWLPFYAGFVERVRCASREGASQ